MSRVVIAGCLEHRLAPLCASISLAVRVAHASKTFSLTSHPLGPLCQPFPVHPGQGALLEIRAHCLPEPRCSRRNISRSSQTLPYHLHLYLKILTQSSNRSRALVCFFSLSGAFLTRAVVRAVNAFFKKAVAIQYFWYRWTYLQAEIEAQM